jgi:hypothetical protein
MRVAAIISFLCLGIGLAGVMDAPQRPGHFLANVLARAAQCPSIEEWDCVNPGTGCQGSIARCQQEEIDR